MDGIPIPSKGGESMDEAVELGKLLHDTPDLFPWVVLAIICIIAVAQHKRIFAYFDARIEAYGDRKKSDAIVAELIRNNTAALNNNTAALESVKQDRGETRRFLMHHEELSAERDKHIQTVVNRIDENVTQNRKFIELLEDRTGK